MQSCMMGILDAVDKRAVQDQVSFGGSLGLFRVSDVCRLMFVG